MNSSISSQLKRFNYIISETDALYHEASLKMGLSDSAMKILYTLCGENGRCYLSEIARKNALSKQTVNSSIRKLEQDDLVYLEKGEGRNLYVCFTENGKKFARRHVMPLQEAESTVLSSWDEKDARELVRLCEKFRTDLEKMIALIPERE